VSKDIKNVLNRERGKRGKVKGKSAVGSWKSEVGSPKLED